MLLRTQRSTTIQIVLRILTGKGRSDCKNLPLAALRLSNLDFLDGRIAHNIKAYIFENNHRDLSIDWVHSGQRRVFFPFQGRQA